MSRPHNNPRSRRFNKLISEPPLSVPDEYTRLVKADQRFQAALDRAITTGGERIQAVQATVDLKRGATRTVLAIRCERSADYEHLQPRPASVSWVKRN